MSTPSVGGGAEGGLGGGDGDGGGGDEGGGGDGGGRGAGADAARFSEEYRAVTMRSRVLEQELR